MSNWYKDLLLKQYQKLYPWAIEAMVRDGYKCVDCGESNRDKLIVHHLDESREAGRLNNNLDNLVTLCRICHSKRHGLNKNLAPLVLEMREMGYTYEEIGIKLGFSRQRAYELYKKQIDT